MARQSTRDAFRNLPCWIFLISHVNDSIRLDAGLVPAAPAQLLTLNAFLFQTLQKVDAIDHADDG